MKAKFNRIKKIKDIEKTKICQKCRKGICKLKMIYIIPTSGKVGLSYGNCDRHLCTGIGLLEFTDIVIEELVLGEIK
ncbi:MAG: hypothetical protein PHP08_00040 [Candidatus Dojkabacteria bacterium]|nr:hypothetical protein [Candidatus Dojkabacteria bacterium]